MSYLVLECKELIFRNEEAVDEWLRDSEEYNTFSDWVDGETLLYNAGFSLDDFKWIEMVDLPQYLKEGYVIV